MNLSLLEIFLPEGLLSHFYITNFKGLGDTSVKKDAFHN